MKHYKLLLIFVLFCVVTSVFAGYEIHCKDGNFSTTVNSGSMVLKENSDKIYSSKVHIVHESYISGVGLYLIEFSDSNDNGIAVGILNVETLKEGTTYQASGEISVFGEYNDDGNFLDYEGSTKSCTIEKEKVSNREC